MSLVAPITVSEAARHIQQWLTQWAEPRGGYAKLMPNMRHLWEDLLTLSETPRILIVFDGEKPRGSQTLDRDYRVDRGWKVALVRGHGFKTGLNEPVGNNAETFLEQVEAVRDRVRVILSISEELPVDYLGMDLLSSIMKGQVANVFGDGYLLKFGTANDIPEVYLDKERTKPVGTVETE